MDINLNAYANKEQKNIRISQTPSEKTSKNSFHKKNMVQEKEIYFLIFYPNEEKEKPDELDFSISEIKPKIIYITETKIENDKYLYKKVFKKKESSPNISLNFNLGKDNYIISFIIKENSFVYDVTLEKRNKYLPNIAKENIDQNTIEYYNKLDIFIDALKQNKEEDKIEILYKDTIELYSKKKTI